MDLLPNRTEETNHRDQGKAEHMKIPWGEAARIGIAIVGAVGATQGIQMATKPSPSVSSVIELRLSKTDVDSLAKAIASAKIVVPKDAIVVKVNPDVTVTCKGC